MKNPLIKCVSLSKIYKSGEVETKALIDINLEIYEGEFVAIMGPSGSGKSTLMHILGCLDSPSFGQYFLAGEDVSRLSEIRLAEVRLKKIGFVFQSYNLLPRTTVLRNVMLPLVYAKVSRKKRERLARRALEMSAFPEKFIYHYPNQLSGGMMQRVAIARALINNPLMILADEPTGNLDSKTGDRLMQTLVYLNQKANKTIILVTHEAYIAEYAKRIIFLKDGRIVNSKTVKN